MTDQPTPDRAVAPTGVNHIVLNVSDIDRSHAFWTDILGFEQVGELHPTDARPNPPTMRFYSGHEHGDVNHHDLALVEIAADDSARDTTWTLQSPRPGLNHVAITWPDRDAWQKQLNFMQSRGVEFLRRINHGMTHSVYIADPDGHGIEVLYELPADVWQGDIDASLNYVESLPTEGSAALIDSTDNPVFERA